MDITGYIINILIIVIILIIYHNLFLKQEIDEIKEKLTQLTQKTEEKSKDE